MGSRKELAAFTGREAALLFSTGYMANVGVISALAARGEIILQDKLNHASLLDGARLSDATLQRYRHADASDAARYGRCGAGPGQPHRHRWRVQHGWRHRTAARTRIAGARAQQAWLLVDDAHGLGVMGATGRGSLELAGLTQADVPLLVGTLGKAFGCFGAFVAGQRDAIELILQRARSYIFTTALPPAVAAATRVALRTLQQQAWRRERVLAAVARFRTAATARGIALMESCTPIQPVPVPGAARCAAASDALRARGYWVAAIRSPTVPAGTERLRVTLTAAHRDEDIDGLADALAQVLHALPAPTVEQPT